MSRVVKIRGRAGSVVVMSRAHYRAASPVAGPRPAGDIQRSRIWRLCYEDFPTILSSAKRREESNPKNG
ncbi:hypothetical protein L249_8586 [Ophiocordyceps polyrhachis-furcata BCC 54312]|uniref:Uncharacterized protein n=1 Tax=Ophiocordyceps polyrhachis-furcata BCC 54312 TaxID=1330021 RepID=A0A367L6C9_9HYPO|nr:hypothetical protein L249_8586 [Ophiocordyceps polyrhachis-furcata BCC 54312]